MLTSKPHTKNLNAQRQTILLYCEYHEPSIYSVRWIFSFSFASHFRTLTAYQLIKFLVPISVAQDDPTFFSAFPQNHWSDPLFGLLLRAMTAKRFQLKICEFRLRHNRLPPLSSPVDRRNRIERTVESPLECMTRVLTVSPALWCQQNGFSDFSRWNWLHDGSVRIKKILWRWNRGMWAAAEFPKSIPEKNIFNVLRGKLRYKKTYDTFNLVKIISGKNFQMIGEFFFVFLHLEWTIDILDFR